MAYESVPYFCFPAIGKPENCQQCPSATAVVAAASVALRALRKKYDERPDKGRDRGLCVRPETDARLRETDPEYARLVDEYEVALRQRDDIKEICPGAP